ncbi:hypothetical protein JOQ06_030489 [Pogonophryne albipinna]|uniref:Sulfotransferase n=1 Tax=Pogonophryne albipinna TaxID=1090488 RepID=A0AAD6AX52_9TELE|nr:hypothetical protein JOQ06_030489 [Pogonophryne albipinna]
MKDIVPLIMSGGDPEPVDNIVNWKRVPWLELQQTASLELEQRPSPRLLTTHFQSNMMPPSFFEVKPKVIYVTRNPKDVFTSSFHHHEAASFLVDPGPQTQFLHNFLDGKVMFGSWFDHVKSWLNAEDEEHIMHISYEQMIMDLKDSVGNMAQFLQKPLDHEAIEKIADRCLFKNMKKNNMSNYSTVPRELLDQTKLQQEDRACLMKLPVEPSAMFGQEASALLQQAQEARRCAREISRTFGRRRGGRRSSTAQAVYPRQPPEDLRDYLEDSRRSRRRQAGRRGGRTRGHGSRELQPSS